MMKVYEGNLVTSLEDYQGKWALSPCGNVIKTYFSDALNWFIIEPFPQDKTYKNHILIDIPKTDSEIALELKILKESRLKEKETITTSYGELYIQTDVGSIGSLISGYLTMKWDSYFNILTTSTGLVLPTMDYTELLSLANEVCRKLARRHQFIYSVNQALSKEELDLIVIEY